MPSRSRLLSLAIIAIAIALVLIFAYVNTFGTKLSETQDVWGQFGDFFGEILNPIFAFFAFVGVLYNLHLQAEQLEITREEFRNSSQAAQAQIDALRQQATREEIVAIVRSLSDSIDVILDETVSPQNAAVPLKLRHVVHEGWRLGAHRRTGGPYAEYVFHAQSAGSVIEALHNRLRSAADGLAYFFPVYEKFVGKESPVLRYYSHRFIGLGVLLEDVGGTTRKTVDFFRQAELES